MYSIQKRPKDKLISVTEVHSMCFLIQHTAAHVGKCFNTLKFTEVYLTSQLHSVYPEWKLEDAEQKKRGSKNKKHCTEPRWQQHADRMSASLSSREPLCQTDSCRSSMHLTRRSSPRWFRHFYSTLQSLSFLFLYLTVTSLFISVAAVCLSVWMFSLTVNSLHFSA